MQVVVETAEYIKQANKCMDAKSQKEFVDYIARNPVVGDIMVGTGGVRKIRWTGDSNRGKRGGVRVIYYYHNNAMPIFLFTVYAKNEKDDLSKAECTMLYTVTKNMVKAYEGEKNE